MLIAAMGYFYVMAILSIIYMVNGMVVLGSLLLVFGAIMPVGLWAWFVSRRRRGRVARYQEELERRALLAAEENAETDERA
ncbi:MAG: hypothetical protein JO218_12800 [Burkholderiales bacterium]|nr:hypothetical protein [Burkholderiales bacterium]